MQEFIQRSVTLILKCIFIASQVQRLCLCVSGEECKYEQTEIYTGTDKYNNGLIIPPSLIKIYNYRIYDNVRYESQPHRRACICLIRPCTRLCCNPNDFTDDPHICDWRYHGGIRDYSKSINVTFSNGSVILVDVFKQFAVQFGYIKMKMYPLTPGNAKSDWTLHENGSLYRHYDRKFLTTEDYCLAIHRHNDDVYRFMPMNNYTDSVDESIGRKLNSIFMIISTPFLLITIAVYLFNSDKLTLHEKCVICYLSMLVISYSVLGVSNWLTINTNICKILGHVVYAAFMSAFLWLCCISYDLWLNFSNINPSFYRNKQHKRFIRYAIFTWLMALMITSITIGMQFMPITKKLKPNIGVEYCFIDVRSWSAGIYYYGVAFILLLFNAFMFIRTSSKIFGVRREISTIAKRSQGSMRSNCESTSQAKFFSYVRLFAVMGITWIFDVCTYLLHDTDNPSWILCGLDLCNASQGIIVFILFVLLRPKTKRRIRAGYTFIKNRFS